MILNLKHLFSLCFGYVFGVLGCFGFVWTCLELFGSFGILECLENVVNFWSSVNCVVSCCVVLMLLLLVIIIFLLCVFLDRRLFI